MIACKCSMHIGKKLNLKHNHRDFDREKWNKDEHINYDLTDKNTTLIQTDLKNFYAENFGKALLEFNEKNESKHKDRCIGLTPAKEFLQNCVKYGKDKAIQMRLDKAVNAYIRQTKHQVQECILQFGDSDTYAKVCDKYGQDKAIQLYTDYLTKAYKEWQKINPQMRVFDATIHVDEATPHLHIDYVPIGNYTRGMQVKASMGGALSSQGYKRQKNEKYGDTAWDRWQADSRQHFEDFARQFWGNKIDNLVVLQSNKSEHTHQEYKEYTNLDKAKQVITNAFSKIKKAITQNKDTKVSDVLHQITAICNNALAMQQQVKMDKLKAQRTSEIADDYIDKSKSKLQDLAEKEKKLDLKELTMDLQYSLDVQKRAEEMIDKMQLSPQLQDRYKQALQVLMQQQAEEEKQKGTKTYER